MNPEHRFPDGTVLPMTEVSRGVRSRRGDRGSAWILLSTLLVLAIGASSTLVFTNRVELLRLAVILALWAAVVAAFVTVIYRRQSELDQARARDMKFVYDLQLDREISARREYELSVESHLRRTLSREIRAEAADEMAALRNELMALRSQLEVMIGTDLATRPALESDRVAMPMPMPIAPGRVESRRVVAHEDRISVPRESRSDIESRIIDVPEEPLVGQSDLRAAVPPPAGQDYYPPDYRGSHRRPAEGAVTGPIRVQRDPAAPVVLEPGVERPRAEMPGVGGPGVRGPVVGGPVVEGPVVGGESPVAAPASAHVVAQPEPQRGEPLDVQRQPPEPHRGEPLDAQRQPEVRLGRHMTSDRPTVQFDPYFPAEPAPEPPRGRHGAPPDSDPVPPGRHRPPQSAVAEPVAAPVAEEPPVQPGDDQSFADLMARFKVNPPPGGGGRRRREV
jgi:hypothetical protein